MPTLRDSQYRAFARRELHRRQSGRCIYCSRELTKTGPTRMTIEHLKAKMKGGKDDLKNLAAACFHCNQLRGQQMNATKQRKEVKAVSARVSSPALRQDARDASAV
ncbi:HNH endonuclease [Mesorhizobium cantuariense]|uniref:HNH endonuclease n=1 Tax=Mesorhizobium cantuariense TaxID=1300275 RepID=A0ABV7MIU8_9HYPH